jgi:hypothetical protein
MRKWCIMDLVINHQTGKLRETALWSNLFKTAVLVSYCRFVTAANFETMTFVAGGLLIGHELVKAKQNQDQQRLDKEVTNVKPAQPL